MSRTTDRRTFVRQTAAIATGLAAPALMLKSARAQAGFNWKQFQGQKIEVMLVKSPRGDLLQRHQKEFEDLTGIQVGAEQIPEQQHRQKAAIEAASGNTSYDVVQLSYHVQKRQFGAPKWLEDLRDMIKDAKLTNPEIDMADFSPAGMNYATQPDGRMDSLPQFIDYWAVYWNKELFAKKGVAYPKNFDEMLAAAAKLNDPAAGISGFVGRGLKNANVPVWTQLLLGWGVDTIDPKTRTMNTDSAEAIAAAELYKKLNKDYAPAGVAGFNWNECQTAFLQGRAAMWLDGLGFAPPLEDATKSRVVGKVGYGVTPAGPRARHSAIFGDGIGISATSKKKQASWMYLQWATSKANQARVLQTGSGAPARLSAYRDPTALGGLKVPREWVDSLVESAKIGRAGLPEIVPVTEFRDTFGIALTNLINGADPATELKKATEAFKPQLAKG